MVTATTALADETASLSAFTPITAALLSLPTRTPGNTQPVIGVIAVDMDGANPKTLGFVHPIQMRWPKKNAPVEVDIGIDLDDPGFNEIDPRTAGNREVQIWRNGAMLGWFKPVTRRADSKTRQWVITCKDPLWYFTRKYVGKANRTNYLTNGGFESGTSGWTANGTITFTADTADPLVDAHDGKLVGTSADARITQSFPITAGGVGVALFLTAWRRIVAFTAPASLNLGSTIKRVGASGPGSVDSAAVTSTTARGLYARDSLVVNMPPNVVEMIEVDLYVGDGERHYDAVTVTVEESLDFASNPSGTGGQDQASIMSQIILYAQGRGPWGGLAPDKPDLHVDTNMPATGKLKNRVYQLADHQKIYDGGGGFGICDEFLQAVDGVDWRCVSTPAGKVITTYFPAFAPDTGIVLTYVYDQHVSEVPVKRGIESWTYGDSLEASANAIIELGGWGSTTDAFASREEGGFLDPSTLGGITLELIESAPNGAPIGTLDTLAAGRGAQLKNPITTPTFTVKEPRDPITNEVTEGYIGVILPGAIVHLNVRDGTLAMSGPASVATVQLDFATEEMAITVDA